jgi:2-polyprenyl-3-methyl-5-hydroxy-6-metoxy-1,4-benzoquinol methylase
MRKLGENNMKYYSFNTRDYLILEHIPLDRNLTLLEIGVGLGSIAERVSGKIKTYCGVDIACEVIDYLSSLYKNSNSVKWRCLDVCQETSSLNEKFDIIFSAHTLEHVDFPQGYFNFIKKHLKSNGFAFVVFPNETKDKHHGITWFYSKNELIEIIDKANLKAMKLLEVKETIWHRTIKKLFWELPKSIILTEKTTPQTFEQTRAFKIVRAGDIKTNILSFYAKAITKLAMVFPLYKYFNNEGDIKNKQLFVVLRHKK